MRAIEKFYTSKRECSVQEAVYLLMPELWLQKPFPGVIFLNGNMPEKNMEWSEKRKHRMNFQRAAQIFFNEKC